MLAGVQLATTGEEAFIILFRLLVMQEVTKGCRPDSLLQNFKL